MTRGHRKVFTVATGILALSLVMPSLVRAQAKCCECGAAAGDPNTTSICFTDPGNNSDCSSQCSACSLQVTEFNANNQCDQGESAPRCAGKTFANANSGGNCPAAPGECETAGDCDDSNACTTDSCDSNTCVNTAITCPASTNTCVASTCDVDTGCGFMNLDGASCNDLNACTANDTCSGGTCVGSPIAGCVPTAPAPAVSPWGLVVMGAGLLVLPLIVLRRRVRRG